MSQRKNSSNTKRQFPNDRSHEDVLRREHASPAEAERANEDFKTASGRKTSSPSATGTPSRPSSPRK